MRISRLTLWNIVWAVLSAAGLFFICWVFPGYEHIEFDDLPSGASADGDRWLGGRFLGHAATNVRRIERWHGNHYSAKDIGFFVRIPMPQAEFEREVQRWQADPAFEFRRYDRGVESVQSFWPSWFPPPSAQNYVGELTGDHHWHIIIYRVPGDDSLYLEL